MDGFDSRDNVIVMAASNMLEKLDQALLRPGRFDRQVFVPPPDMRGRQRILGVHTRDKPLAQDVDLERVARHTAGLTGADLANLCNEAAILAGRNDRDFITQRDFENAFERVVAGLQSRKVITAHEKRVVAWHEAGHALVSELLPTVDKVQKVSIVPRGKALGYTLNLPQEDRYLKSREELIDYMKVLLAGRVSEQITFGRVTTGASDDLKRVTDIARSMVYEYGMGTSIRSHQVPADDFTVSEALRRTRDEEVQAICRGGLPRRPPPADRPPRPARRDRRAAARQRGDRARRDPRIMAQRRAEIEVAERELDDVPRRGLASESWRAAGATRPSSRRSAASIDWPACSSASTTSASRSRTSTPPSRSTRRASGCRVAHRETVESQGVEAVLLDVGDGHVELLRPLGPETAVGKFIASAAARACTTSPTGSTTSTRRSSELKQAGLELIDAEARVGIRGSRVAFLHPKSTGGVLTEIVEPAEALMSDGRMKRVEIGFGGGQVMPCGSTEDELEAPAQARSASERRAGTSSSPRTASSRSTCARSSSSRRGAAPHTIGFSDA